MSSTASANGSAKPIMNGTAGGMSKMDHDMLQLNLELKNPDNDKKYTKFHGDELIGVSNYHAVTATC